MTIHEERQKELEALQEKKARQKIASEHAPKFIPSAQEELRFKDNHIAEPVKIPATPQSWGSYFYEHATPTNIALATIGILGALWTGHTFKNEIYNFIKGNNGRPALNNHYIDNYIEPDNNYIEPNNGYIDLPIYRSPIEERNRLDIDVIHPLRLFDADQAETTTDNIITFLRDTGDIQTYQEEELFRRDFPILIRESGASYNALVANYQSAKTIKGPAFDDIFLNADEPHEKIIDLNIKPGLIMKVINSAKKSKGMSHADKKAMYKYLNAQDYKYLTYLMFKVVYGQKIEELDQDPITDEQTLDTGLSDYKIAANEEAEQAETSPNIAAYSKQALSLDLQATPSWEMLKDQLTCSNTLVIKEKEAINDDQVIDETCPAMDIAPPSLLEKSILAYEPGTCHIIMKSLQTIGYTTGLQSLVSYFINSRANPYIALASKLVLIPLSQSILIDKLCDNMDIFFANKASSIQEDILYKNLLEEALSNMPTEEARREAFISESDFIPEYNSCSNTTTTDYSAYNQTNDSSLATEPSILLGLTIPKLILDYHST